MSLLFFAGLLPAQHQISLSGGWSEQVAFYPDERQSAPVMGISYGFRPIKWFELEAGLLTAIQPGQQLCSAHGCFDPDDRYFWIPLGARFVLPLKRLEFSFGGGGLYENYSVSNGPNPFGIHSHDGWGGYFTGGAAVKLTRHFWVGATPRVMLANPGTRAIDGSRSPGISASASKHTAGSLCGHAPRRHGVPSDF